MVLSTDSKLDTILEELDDLKSVWEALADIWQKFSVLKDKPWATTSPRKIRQDLDKLLAETKDLPNRVRTYAAFDFTQNALKDYIKVNPILSELKSEALQDRHWKQLFKTLCIEKSFIFSEMTIGNIWDFDLRKNELAIKEIVTQATGEMALEEFLKQVINLFCFYFLN